MRAATMCRRMGRTLWFTAGIAALPMAAPAWAAAPPAKQTQSFEKCTADFAALQKLYATIGQKQSAVDARTKQLADMYVQLNQKRIGVETRDAAAQAEYKKLLEQYQAQSKDLTDNLTPDVQKTQASYTAQNAAYEKSCQ